MSKLPLSDWNHLCRPDTVNWNLDSLLKVYNDEYIKYDRYYQNLRNAPTYRGVGFQGFNNNDHLSAVKQGIIFLDPDDNVIKPIPPDKLGPHLEYQKGICVRHKNLCLGEFSKILDYLEGLGYHTFRARIMELGPGHQGKWHVDSYPNMWGNNQRYHIPLVTNDECYIQWNEKPIQWNEMPLQSDGDKFFHMPADGRGYWINTDINHRYFNNSNSWRAHIVIDLIKK